MRCQHCCKACTATHAHHTAILHTHTTQLSYTRTPHRLCGVRVWRCVRARAAPRDRPWLWCVGVCACVRARARSCVRVHAQGSPIAWCVRCVCMCVFVFVFACVRVRVRTPQGRRWRAAPPAQCWNRSGAVYRPIHARLTNIRWWLTRILRFHLVLQMIAVRLSLCVFVCVCVCV